MKLFIAMILFAVFIVLSPKQKIEQSEMEPVKIDKSYLDNDEQQDIEKYGYLVFEQANSDLEFTSLTLAIIKTESDFEHGAKSHKGATGLMQLMPSTASDVRLLLGMEVVENDLIDPHINVKLGVEYMRYIQNRLEGIEDDERRLILTLASYNSGLHRVKRSFECRGFECYIQRANLCTQDQFNNALDSLPEETRNYLKSVKSHYVRYKKYFNVV